MIECYPPRIKIRMLTFELISITIRMENNQKDPFPAAIDEKLR